MVITFSEQDLFPFMASAVQIEGGQPGSASVKLRVITKSGAIVLCFESASALRGFVNRIKQRLEEDWAPKPLGDISP